jgi:hypothetical protein
MTKIQSCKGCLLYNENYKCASTVTLNNEDCPCSLCLVKMVCRKICPALQSYKEGVKQKMKGCNGCYYNRLCYGGDKKCILLDYNHVIKGCPCSICLVKMVCKKRCNNFMTFFEMFDGIKGKYYLDKEEIIRKNYDKQ